MKKSLKSLQRIIISIILQILPFLCEIYSPFKMQNSAIKASMSLYSSLNESQVEKIIEYIVMNHRVPEARPPEMKF